MNLDFNKYYQIVKQINAPEEFKKNFLEALHKVEATGKTIAGLEELERTSYFIPAIRPLRDSAGLGVYWGPGQAEDLGKRVGFIPLYVTRIKVIRNIDTKIIERRFFDPRVRIPEMEGKQVLIIPTLLAITRDFKNFFAIEGLGTRLPKLQDFIAELKRVNLRKGIYETQGELIRKREKRNGREFASFDILLSEELLPEELLPLAELAFDFVRDYILYRKAKSVVTATEQEAEETLPEPTTEESQNGNNSSGGGLEELKNLV
jgi:hypothetical protein